MKLFNLSGFIVYQAAAHGAECVYSCLNDVQLDDLIDPTGREIVLFPPPNSPDCNFFNKFLEVGWSDTIDSIARKLKDCFPKTNKKQAAADASLVKHSPVHKCTRVWQPD